MFFKVTKNLSYLQHLGPMNVVKKTKTRGPAILSRFFSSGDENLYGGRCVTMDFFLPLQRNKTMVLHSCNIHLPGITAAACEVCCRRLEAGFHFHLR